MFEPSPGTVVRGHAQIRAALDGFVTLRPTMSARVVQVLATDDLALVVNEWSMSGTGPDGETVHQAGRSTDVVRRQPDGRWMVAVDKP